MDLGQRIILWNDRCAELLGRPARWMLGRRCHDVVRGRDSYGNTYCRQSCPVAAQARDFSDPVHMFPLAITTEGAVMKWFDVTTFAIPSDHPALSTVVHVIREKDKSPSALERHLTTRAAACDALLPASSEGEELVVLTPREKEILILLAEGHTTARIVQRLSIAAVTVRNHIAAILLRLGVHSKLEAVVFAYRHELVSRDSALPTSTLGEPRAGLPPAAPPPPKRKAPRRQSPR